MQQGYVYNPEHEESVVEFKSKKSNLEIFCFLL